eukprot:7450567-Pyramimonas_sp.AAC.1
MPVQQHVSSEPNSNLSAAVSCSLPESRHTAGGVTPLRPAADVSIRTEQRGDSGCPVPAQQY